MRINVGNCDNVEEVEVTDTEVTVDGVTMTHKGFKRWVFTSCGFTLGRCGINIEK